MAGGAVQCTYVGSWYRYTAYTRRTLLMLMEGCVVCVRPAIIATRNYRASLCCAGEHRALTGQAVRGAGRVSGRGAPGAARRALLPTNVFSFCSFGMSK